MDGIKIEVTGNIARVIERPVRITAGTVGLPVEFTFDSQWDGLRKTAVFRAGHLGKIVENLVTSTTVPWEVIERPGAWLSIGVYGVNKDGSVAFPTTWANVCAICIGATPDCDPATDPALPVWQKLEAAIRELQVAIGVVTGKVLKGEVTLLASKWVGDASPYSQVVSIDGVTQYSLVDLQPSVEQLEIFREKDVTFTTENDDGVVTVYAVGDKPKNDYTIQVTITEVAV